jgi:hypothetical protein
MDPVVEQRARVARAVAVAKRVGYLLFAAAAAFVVVGLLTGFAPWAAAGATTTLIGGSVVLAPAILLGYAVKGAERHEQEHGLQRRDESP